MRIVVFSLLTFFTCSVHATPCDGIDRLLDENRKSQLAPIIAKQLNIKSAEILESFRYGEWHIISVETHVSDEPFLFFKGDPVHNIYLTIWSGAALIDEEQEIKKWVLKNAKDIPTKLAGCFAWYVTKDRARK